MGRATRTSLFLALGAVLAVSACDRVSNSGLNPFNWFGGGGEVTLQDYETGRVPDPRGLVEQVVGLDVARTPGGAIVTARGLPPTQGWWEGSLVPVTGEGIPAGVLVFQFRISPPPEAKRVGPPRSREVVVGRFVSDQTLEGVREIQVLGAANAMRARR